MNRRAASFRRRFGSLALLVLALAMAGPATAQNLSFYGTPGLVDMPTAEPLPDGTFALTSANYGPIWRNSLTFQITPRISGSFRYSNLGSLFRPNSDYYDRSFDLTILLREEDDVWPAISLGLRDFGGTGLQGGEFVVASKYVTPRLQLTAGIGWGRFAGRGGFENPLGVINDAFETRPERSTRTGEIGFDHWFRGDAAVFGGFKWHATDRLTLMAEYSSDTYPRESEMAIDPQSSPYNFGLSYRFRNGVDLGAYYLYGNEVGLRLSYLIDPARPRVPAGQESAPPTLLPRSTVAGQSWNLGGTDEVGQRAAHALDQRLGEQGLRLVRHDVRGHEASAEIENLRFGATAQAAGRAARVMANTLDPSVRVFEVTLAEKGMRLTRIRVERADLEEQEHALEGEWHMLARADIADAFQAGGSRSRVAVTYPHLSWGLSPYASFSLFDPDDPLRYEVGVQANAAWEPRPGLILSGQIRKPLHSTIDDATRRSFSVLPHVRSDAVLYAVESDLRITHLTAEYFFRPREDMFGRLTAGYLEPMFGGVSAELLWYPLNSRLALGAEVNYAVQRDFKQLFGFQDYSIWTGHASAYYDLGRGYHGQIDFGRYLAGDWGATFTLDRRFNNGVKVGAFATFTDVSFDDFGEGSFDKGIFVEVPLSWITGQPSRAVTGQVIRPIQRDGGARLSVRNRLYNVVDPYRGGEIVNSWGKYLR
ncbi:YjbH domain-containing protein [Vannielia litorea]|uniref:Exopolysaccharide biosynthesis protein YbjH n=1 Tax=Vannielia litorea TaxID=1217970 RepID=A0A1N6G5T5_9RHOB|nr:YjbH domain-containing protein [Vannielia litorea]SIO02905.1 Exopolysaccharide biosynthesis protein YbjH [Vannielia litorea]